MTHTLKLRSEFWDAVMDGSKCFEIRSEHRIDYIKTDCNTLVQLADVDSMFNVTHAMPFSPVSVTNVVFGMRRMEGVE